MTNHTPGPWTNSDGLVFGQESRAKFIPSPSLDIFNAYEWPRELREEALANADLIAAAPGLLNALIAILPWHDSHPSEATDNRIVNLCRAAIKKAKGET